MKIVLDTNVLISGMINPYGAPGKIVDSMRNGEIVLVTDDRILSEYSDVLRRDAFNIYFDAEARADILEYLLRSSHYTVSRVIVADLPDPGDVPFLEIALTEKVILVTGNLKHFPEGSRRGAVVLTPAELVRTLMDPGQGPESGPSNPDTS